MGIFAEIKRAVDPMTGPVIADGLRDRQDVRFIEGRAKRRTPVAVCAEVDSLIRVLRIGSMGIIKCFQLRWIAEDFFRRWLSREPGNSRFACAWA